MADVAAFTLDVALPRDAKAVHEGQDGDLIIEGFASDFNVDREDEMFEAGAFSKGVRESSTAPPHSSTTITTISSSARS